MTSVLADVISVAFGAVIIFAVVAWLRRRPRKDPYDLKRLFDEPVGEAYDDMVDSESGPYCNNCDHPNPPGTNFCRSCGRKF